LINKDHDIEDVLIARVNCEEASILCEYLKIRGYPALYFFEVIISSNYLFIG
jgi:hypothetical protein